jgi:hypothetical protein
MQYMTKLQRGTLSVYKSAHQCAPTGGHFPTESCELKLGDLWRVSQIKHKIKYNILNTKNGEIQDRQYVRVPNCHVTYFRNWIEEVLSYVMVESWS